MAYSDLEQSRFRGKPIELYLFRYGSGADAVYGYTNADDVVTREGLDYKPIPIQRDSVKASGTLDKSLLSIRMPKTEAVPEMFRVYPPSRVVSITIFAGHLDDDNAPTDFKAIYAGRVINAKREANEGVLGCEPISTSMRRTALRQFYQYSCPHQLYGPRCRATKTLFPAVVATIDGTIVELYDGWNTSGQPDKQFLGGLVEWQSLHNVEPRTILKMLNTNVFLLSGALTELAANGEVNVALGCPHTLRGCETVHNNVQNYGGDPFIPFESPFGGNPF